MGTDPERVEAARAAERAVWDECGLAISERFIEVGDAKRRVRVLECGDPKGEPLVFVQGGLGEGFGWAPLMSRLREFRCVTLDRPGGGLSDGVDFMAVEPRLLAIEVLSAVLDTSGIDRATFVANSMGGWWSFQLAMARQARVSRLILLGCPAVLNGTAAPLPMRLMSLRVLGRGMSSMMVPSSPDKARGVAAVLGHPKEVGEGWSPAFAEAFYRMGNLPNFRPSWRTLVRRFLRVGGVNPKMRINADQLKTVEQPALFLWGAKDPFGTVEAGRAAAGLMPKARLEVVGIGHVPWWDDPDTCARYIREFIPARA